MKKIRIFAVKFGCVRRRLIKFFSCLLIAVVLTIIIMINFVNPIIKDIGRSKISESTNYAVNLSVQSAMLGTITYEDLVHIVTDAGGKIRMLQANSIQINLLSRKVIDNTYNNIMTRIGENLLIPVGAFSGIPIFSGLGPKISVPTIPYGSVNCTFLSEFKSAGINQTIHKIYLSVFTKISLILPFNKIEVEEVTEVLISESLIIGEIPDTYLMAEEKSDLLNMVG